MICSVGCVTGFRDYATLVDAARGLPVQVKLAVGSLILSVADRQRRADRFRAAIPPSELPENIEYRLDLPATTLRDLYARSRFVVMPLEEVDFDAGVTSITEAMAMGKAVVVTRNRGQVDVVRDGVEGLYVPARDPRALREAITYLLENPSVAERMGAAGARRCSSGTSSTTTSARVAEIVRLSDRSLSERAQYTSETETGRVDEVPEAVDELTQLGPVAPHGLDLLRRELVVQV